MKTTELELRQRSPSCVELEINGPADVDQVRHQVSQWLSVDDDLAPFYARVAEDSVAYQRHVQANLGMHHVRFFTLCESVVWFVLTQRTPRTVSRSQRQRLIDTYGSKVQFGSHELPVFPQMEALMAAGPVHLGETLRNARKGTQLHEVLTGVAKLDTQWLRSAPIEFANAALQEIRGVGPFTSAAILLRGLGRMEDSPIEMPSFSAEAEAVYGKFSAAEIRRRYQGQLGYWSWYLKNSSS